MAREETEMAREQGQKTKHTEGPWQAAPLDPEALTFSVASVVPRADGDRVDVTNVANVASAEDARLIAAAPDLLEACKTVLLAMENVGPALKELDAPWPQGSVFGVVRAAIDKAETEVR